VVCKEDEQSQRHTSRQFAVEQRSDPSSFVEADAGDGVEHQNVAALMRPVADDEVSIEPSLLMSNHSAYVNVSQSDDDTQQLPVDSGQCHSLHFHFGEQQ